MSSAPDRSHRPRRQFVDRGDQYRSAIFVKDDAQRKLAEASKKKLEKTKRFEGKRSPPRSSPRKFWPAEAYHQDYYKKNPSATNTTGGLRARRVSRETWGKERRRSSGEDLVARFQEALSGGAAQALTPSSTRSRRRTAPNGLPERIRRQPPRGDLRGRRLRRAALLVAGQIRKRHRLAKLLRPMEPATSSSGRTESPWRPHRGSEPPRRVPSWPRFPDGPRPPASATAELRRLRFIRKRRWSGGYGTTAALREVKAESAFEGSSLRATITRAVPPTRTTRSFGSSVCASRS